MARELYDIKMKRHGPNGITESGLRLRWDNKLDPRISKLPFTDLELEEISKMKSESKSWKEISRVISEKYCKPSQRRTALDCFKAFRIGLINHHKGVPNLR